jgi:hypothetical protein
MEVSGQLHAPADLDAVESNPDHPADILITIFTELPRHIFIMIKLKTKLRGFSPQANYTD